MTSPQQMDPALEAGELVDGTYRIDERVAHGGSSVIYSARHAEMDRRVALKILPLGEQVDASALERFSQEARLACQINHPNVVTIYQFGQDDRGLLYIAMEWLAGVSLSDAIDERGPFSPLRAAKIGREVARGLAAVHSQNVLHRDLKPSNVMLAELADWEETAKLLDFGVAKSLDAPEEEQLRITQEGKFVGTPRYAAPELIQGSGLSPRTDIYGVGLLTWETLVGEPAVTAAVFQKCCAEHLSDEPWELPDSVDCPDALADVVHKALRKDPDERYDDCRELADAFGEAVHDIASGPQTSSSGHVPVPESDDGEHQYSSGWTRFLFIAAVTAAVLGLAGYQGWLSFTRGATADSEQASVNLSHRVRSPQELLQGLRESGWSVEKRRSGQGEGRAFVLRRGTGTSVSLTVERNGTSNKQGLRVPFRDFTAAVSGDNRESKRLAFRLMADLYMLRASARKNASK